MEDPLDYLILIASGLVLLEYLGAWWLATGGAEARLRRLPDPDYVPGWLFLVGGAERALRESLPRLCRAVIRPGGYHAYR